MSRFLFGPPHPRPSRRGEEDAVVAVVQALGGTVAPADVMRVTGFARARAETLLCRVMARRGGDIEVRDPGAVLYDFPPLRPQRWVLPAPVWQARKQLPPLTGNEPCTDAAIAAANLCVLLGTAAVLARLVVLESWWFLAVMPLLLALLAFVLPLARLIGRGAVRRDVARANGRRGLLRAVLERRAGTTVAAYALSHAWIAAGGNPIRPAALCEEVRALGGEPDVDPQARVIFKFTDLDHEARALAQVRHRRR